LTTRSPAARNLFSDKEQPASLRIPEDTELVQAGTASGPETASPILSHSGARCNSRASGNCQQSDMGHAYSDVDCNNLHNPTQPIVHSQSEGSDGDGGPAAAASDFLAHVQLSLRCATTGGGPSAEDVDSDVAEGYSDTDTCGDTCIHCNAPEKWWHMSACRHGHQHEA